MSGNTIWRAGVLIVLTMLLTAQRPILAEQPTGVSANSEPSKTATDSNPDAPKATPEPTAESKSKVQPPSEATPAVAAPQKESAASVSAAPSTAAVSTTTAAANGGIVGLSFGYSPVFKPKVSADWENSLSWIIDAALRLSRYGFVGVRWNTSTLNSLGLSDSTRVLRPRFMMIGFFGGGEIPVFTPEFLGGVVQLMVPLNMTAYIHAISARGTPYLGMELDFGGGAGLRFNIIESVFLDVDVLYHFGVPLIKAENSLGDKLTTREGREITGGTTGFELRTGITILTN